MISYLFRSSCRLQIPKLEVVGEGVDPCRFAYTCFYMGSMEIEAFTDFGADDYEKLNPMKTVLVFLDHRCILWPKNTF